VSTFIIFQEIILRYIHSLTFESYMVVLFMVFHATFNNISDISWRSVVLVD